MLLYLSDICSNTILQVNGELLAIRDAHQYEQQRADGYSQLADLYNKRQDELEFQLRLATHWNNTLRADKQRLYEDNSHLRSRVLELEQQLNAEQGAALRWCEGVSEDQMSIPTDIEDASTPPSSSYSPSLGNDLVCEATERKPTLQRSDGFLIKD